MSAVGVCTSDTGSNVVGAPGLCCSAWLTQACIGYAY